MLARKPMGDLGKGWKVHLEVDVWMADWCQEFDCWWLYWVGLGNCDVKFP